MPNDWTQINQVNTLANDLTRIALKIKRNELLDKIGVLETMVEINTPELLRNGNQGKIAELKKLIEQLKTTVRESVHE